jgi:hypothetical protein
MRRLTLLLCLLMVAAFRWIIGTTEALTNTEQKEAVLPKTHVTLEAVNTGFKASLVAASIRAENGVLITHALLPAAIDAGVRSIKCGPLLIESTSGVRIHRDRGRQDDRKSPSNPGSGLIGLDKPICNLA